MQRDVQVRADFFGIGGHHGDQFARDFGGFDARKPNAKIARQFGDLLHEIGEADPIDALGGRGSIRRRNGPDGCR